MQIQVSTCLPLARVETGSNLGVIEQGEVGDISPASQAFTICAVGVVIPVHVLAVEVVSIKVRVLKSWKVGHLQSFKEDLSSTLTQTHIIFDVGRDWLKNILVSCSRKNVARPFFLLKENQVTLQFGRSKFSAKVQWIFCRRTKECLKLCGKMVKNAHFARNKASDVQMLNNGSLNLFTVRRENTSPRSEKSICRSPP